MVIYLLRRLLLAVITFFIATLISFSVVYFKGVSNFNHLPLFEAYPFYLFNTLKGFLGISQLNHQPIAEQVIQLFPVTLELAMLAALFALCIGIPLGIIASLYKDKPIDYAIRGFMLVGISTPVFWLALLLLTYFSYSLNWLPPSGRYSLPDEIPAVTGFMFIDVFLTDLPNRGQILSDILKHAFIPMLTLSIPPLVEITRLVRANIIEISRENYIKAATIRGLSKPKLIYHHILHNALPPIIPKLGLQFTTLLTLTMIIEIIFDWHGFGRWILYSLHHQDYAAISAGILVSSLVVILVFIFCEILGILTNPLKRKELYVQ